MTKNYGRWNSAAYYPNCNRIKEGLAEYSTEKMLYGEPMEIQIRNYYNEGEIMMGSFEMNILIRVAASHGLTRRQLENFLLLQGMNIDREALDSCLYNMVKFGYLSWVKFSRTRDDMDIILYDLSEQGVEVLKKYELPYRNPAKEYFISGDIFRYMRAKIVSNQLVLHLLGMIKGLRSFYFQRELKFVDAAASPQSYMAPLYVQTDGGNYIFDIVCNTRIGKKSFQDRMEQMFSLSKFLSGKTVLILVAETHDHMKTLTTLMHSYENRGLGTEVLYTHDSEWFYDIPGSFYAVAHAMGQAGMINVKLV